VICFVVIASFSFFGGTRKARRKAYTINHRQQASKAKAATTTTLYISISITLEYAKPTQAQHTIPSQPMEVEVKHNFLHIQSHSYARFDWTFQVSLLLCFATGVLHKDRKKEGKKERKI